jgi:hypothetical protein
VAALLQDVAHEHVDNVSGVIAEEQVRSLLTRAQELLPYPDQAAQVIALLDQARALAPDQREVWTLAERLLAQNPTVQAETAVEVAQRIERLEHAVAAKDIVEIQALQTLDDAPLLTQVALAREARWQAGCAAGAQVIDLLEGLVAALDAAAAAANRRDYHQALQLLRAFAARELPHASAVRLLDARIRLLEAQERVLGTEGAASILPQLRQARQQRNALDSADGDQTKADDIALMAPTLSSASLAVEGKPDEPAATEAGLEALATDSLGISPSIETSATASGASAADEPATAVNPLLSRPTSDAPGDGWVEEEALPYDDALPIRIRAAREVGTFGATFGRASATKEDV